VAGLTADWMAHKGQITITNGELKNFEGPRTHDVYKSDGESKEEKASHKYSTSLINAENHLMEINTKIDNVFAGLKDNMSNTKGAEPREYVQEKRVNINLDQGAFCSFRNAGELSQPDQSSVTRQGLMGPDSPDKLDSKESKDEYRWNMQNDDRRTNISQISSISPIPIARDKSGFVESSTPYVGRGGGANTSADNDIRKYVSFLRSAKKDSPGDYAYELNSNFLKRIWNLRFVSNQELKVLISDSVIFIGDKKNGLKCGKGKYITQRGGRILYEGYFYDNIYHGEGRLWNPKYSEVDSKNWFKNLDENEGWEYYEGNFSGGFPEGLGKLAMTNGEYIEGIFLRGRLNGIAKVTTRDGTAIKGEWQDNVLINTTHH
jgi:hypothetical protein